MTSSETPCPYCQDGQIKCKGCNGTGSTWILANPYKHWDDPTAYEHGDCMSCLGEGFVPCPACKGTGKMIEGDRDVA